MALEFRPAILNLFKATASYVATKIFDNSLVKITKQNTYKLFYV